MLEAERERAHERFGAGQPRPEMDCSAYGWAALEFYAAAAREPDETAAAADVAFGDYFFDLYLGCV